MRNWVLILIGTALLALTMNAAGVAGRAGAQVTTITMDEFGFTPARVVLPAGEPVVLRLVNVGKIEHEFMVYARPPAGTSHLHEWAHQHNFFEDLDVAVSGGTIERHGNAIVEVRLTPSESAQLRFTPTEAGTFEIGCHIAGHYEAGMKSLLVVKDTDNS